MLIVWAFHQVQHLLSMLIAWKHSQTFLKVGALIPNVLNRLNIDSAMFELVLI